MQPSLVGHLLATLGAIVQALGEPDQMRLIAFVLQPLLYQPQSGDDSLLMLHEKSVPPCQWQCLSILEFRAMQKSYYLLTLTKSVIN